MRIREVRKMMEELDQTRTERTVLDKTIGEPEPLFKTPEERAAFERRQREAAKPALEMLEEISSSDVIRG